MRAHSWKYRFYWPWEWNFFGLNETHHAKHKTGMKKNKPNPIGANRRFDQPNIIYPPFREPLIPYIIDRKLPL